MSFNVDWATFGTIAVSTTENIQITPSGVDVLAITVPKTGRYFAMGIGAAYSGAEGEFFQISLTVNTVSQSQNYATIIGSRVCAQIGLVLDLTKNNVVRLRLQTGGSTINTQNRCQSLMLTRIG